jgi:hypothetical protein
MRVKGKKNCQKAKRIIANAGKVALGEGRTKQMRFRSSGTA